MKRHLFVVAHPDDEVLGAGGFIYQAKDNGDDVAVLVLNTCDTTRYEDNRSKIVDDLKKSHEILGIDKLYTCNYLDSNFHNADHREMVQEIEKVIRDFQPDNVFTQHPGDINTDHYWTAASCMEAVRLWQRGRGEKLNPITGVFLMEVPSSTDWALSPAHSRFNPNTYMEVSMEALSLKYAALAEYENVIRPVPHPRSEEAIMALATHRGAQAGVDFAEAFECVFKLDCNFAND